MQLEEKYQIIKVIGQGANAVVYLVRDRRLCVFRAAKVLSRMHCRRFPDKTEQYLQEVAFLKTLNHPSIPRIIEIFENQNYVCIVMDYIEGKTLRELVNRDGGIPEHEVLKIALQLCHVLKFLHCQKKPVIYGDLKPENIIRRQTGDICILDFGTACRIRKYGACTMSSGTPGYAAPEAVQGRGLVDTRADIYSLGATIYVLLTGRTLELSGLRRRCLLRRCASPFVCRLVRKCMQKNPRRRYRDIEQIQRKLEQIIFYRKLFVSEK